MTDVTLRSEIAGATQAQAPAAPAAAARALTVLSWPPDRRRVRIGPGQAAYVEVHQNANPGWRATLDGRRLAPARLDGWQQAYLVPAGAGGVITMTFAPATLYHAGLAGSALAVLILLAVAVPWRRRRRAADGPAGGGTVASTTGPPADGASVSTARPVTNEAPASTATAAGASGDSGGPAAAGATAGAARPSNLIPADPAGPRHRASGSTGIGR